MQAIEIIIVIFFSTWLFSSILYTFFNQKMSKIIKNIDVFRLLTSYQLFTYSKNYYKLYYRDQSRFGKESEWTEIGLSIPHKKKQAFWFPERQINSYILSIVDDLATLIEKLKDNKEEKTKKIKERFIHQQIFRFVKKQSVLVDEISARQFKITHFISPQNIETIVYISEYEKQ